MADKLKKAGPPPLPANALQPPPASVRTAAMPSPWDVESSAPAPTSRAAAGLQQHMWQGQYPLVKPEHAADLETHAAVNEFGQRMPRAQAEAMAYKHYVDKQRVAAAAHHLAGMKAAHAAGDTETARKHHVMYSIHSRALGHNPVGPAHPAVQKELAAGGKMKFRAHAADALALAPHVTDQGVVSSVPAPAPKASDRGVPYPQPVVQKALHDLYDGLQKLQKRDVTEPPSSKDLQKAEGKRHCACDAYGFPHRHGGGRCAKRKPRGK